MINIVTELQFENRIRDIIQSDIIPNNNLLIMDIQKTTDIIICKNGDNPQIFFIEIKYYNTSHGRLGFGHASGKGFQPEVLRKNPDFFQNNMRWILGSIDSEEYFFVDNKTILKFVSGNSIDYKQNNIQTKIFKEIKGFSKKDLVDQINDWIK